MAHPPENVNYLERVLVLMHQTAYPIAVAPKSQGGLVLVNQHYTDLIGPGSRLIWSKYFYCKAIYVVGVVQFCTLHSPLAQQKSLRNRIDGVAILKRILQDFDDDRRACLLANLLCHRLTVEVVKRADLALLGTLVRVPPAAMAKGLRLYEQNLCQLGQTERFGDQHRLAWQRQQLPLPELLLDAVDLTALSPDTRGEQRILESQPVSVQLG